ncbi:MAG: head-tail connector protein [Bacteroidia bacterium]
MALTEIKVVTPPATELDITTVKNYLRIDFTDDDALLTTLIQSARERAEQYCNRSFITQTLEVYYDKIEKNFTLPRSPIQNVSTVKLIYLNEVSTLTQNADYYVMGNQDQWITITATTYNLPPGFSPGDDLSRYHLDVTYTAGYDSQWPILNGVAQVSKIPMGIAEAIMKMVGAAYQVREDVVQLSERMVTGYMEIPNDAKSLLNAYRVIPL